MKTPRWITWDSNGFCVVWTKKPVWRQELYGELHRWCGKASDLDGLLTEACMVGRKRGGPKAIRRIRLEKV